MSSEQRFLDVVAQRWRYAIGLTIAIIVVYFGFILLIAYNKPLMGTLITPGLSIGIVLGAAVIVVSWLLTWGYVRWANTYYDAAVHEVRREGGAELGPKGGPGK